MAVTTRSQSLKMSRWTPTRSNYKLSKREIEAAKVLTSMQLQSRPYRQYNLRSSNTPK